MTAAALAIALPRLARRSRPAVETPELVASGERLFADKCLHCHRDVPLTRRVAGWSPQRAYDTLARLPQVTPAMPPFHGTDEDRRAVAAFLAAVGRGRAKAP